MQHSYKSAWHEIGGKRNYYRSGWEANYAYYLEWLKNKGQITEWQHEPETFWFSAIKRGVVSYKPDFKVTSPDNNIEYHEVKGRMDTQSKTQIKRMAKYYPKVKLVVIDAKTYKSIEKTMKPMIKEWV